LSAGPASARPVLFGILAVVAACLSSPPAPLSAGALPRLQWEGRSGVDWASGYVISYGAGLPPESLSNRNERRSASLRRALGDASRSLRRHCLNVRVAGDLTLRDYVREDPELQKAFNDLIARLPPWEIRIDWGDGVQVALRVPLGGEGGLSDLLGELRGYGLQGRSEASGFRNGSVGDPVKVKGATGIVILAPLSSTVPALRPRVRGGSGEILVEHGRADPGARARPAFISYHYTLERALEDPVAGDAPIVVASEFVGTRGTDLVIPENLERGLKRGIEGRRLLAEARIVVVLRD
jgi:hypothetical protein